jgi:hypothetical protein
VGIARAVLGQQPILVIHRGDGDAVDLGAIAVGVVGSDSRAVVPDFDQRSVGMSWAQAEFHDLELGDARRTQRLIKLVDDLSAQPTGSIPLACGGWPETKAAYRLLDNPAVEWREILDIHTTRTVERMAGQAGGVVHSGHDGTGFHHATGDCRDWGG